MPDAVIVGPDHPWADRACVPIDELAGETLPGGEPATDPRPADGRRSRTGS